MLLFLLIYQLLFFLSCPPLPPLFFSFSLLFSFIFLLSSACSANLEFLSGIGFHCLVRRPLINTSMAITWFSLPFLHCVKCCFVACCMAEMHGLHRPLIVWTGRSQNLLDGIKSFCSFQFGGGSCLVFYVS